MDLFFELNLSLFLTMSSLQNVCAVINYFDSESSYHIYCTQNLTLLMELPLEQKRILLLLVLFFISRLKGSGIQCLPPYVEMLLQINYGIFAICLSQTFHKILLQLVSLSH
jgi:hypothetical protein